MFKKIATLILLGFVLNLFFYTPLRANNSVKESKNARKVKNEIIKLGSGTQSIVKLKLRDKSELQGYVKEIGDESFTVVDRQSNKETEVSYAKVKKARGQNYSTGQKILIVVGLIFLVGMIVGIASSDDY